MAQPLKTEHHKAAHIHPLLPQLFPPCCFFSSLAGKLESTAHGFAFCLCPRYCCEPCLVPWNVPYISLSLFLQKQFFQQESNKAKKKTLKCLGKKGQSQTMQFWSFQNEWNMANIFNCTQKFMEEIHTYLHFLKEIVLKMAQHSISLLSTTLWFAILKWHFPLKRDMK